MFNKSRIITYANYSKDNTKWRQITFRQAVIQTILSSYQHKQFNTNIKENKMNKNLKVQKQNNLFYSNSNPLWIYQGKTVNISNY